MNVIETLDLGRDSFWFHYKSKTCEYHWEMFHAHQGIEFLYIYQGKGNVIIDQKIYPIDSPTLICFQPYQLHKINMFATKTCPYIRTMFVFDPTLAEQYIKQFPSLYAFYKYLWKGVLVRQVISMEAPTKLPELFSELQQRLQSNPSREHREEFILFLLAFLRSLRANFSPEKEDFLQNREVRHVERIMEWVEEHYKEEFALERLASSLHLSPYHISRIFREEMGCTITDYIIVKRLREACLLLTTTNMSIQAIAREIGLKSNSYFTQLFKKNLGMTPKQYRASSQKIYTSLT